MEVKPLYARLRIPAGLVERFVIHNPTYGIRFTGAEFKALHSEKSLEIFNFLSDKFGAVFQGVSSEDYGTGKLADVRWKEDTSIHVRNEFRRILENELRDAHIASSVMIMVLF